MFDVFRVEACLSALELAFPAGKPALQLIRLSNTEPPAIAHHRSGIRTNSSSAAV